MNTKQEAIELSMKVKRLIEDNKGILMLTMFDDSQIRVRIARIESHLTEEKFTCNLITFTNDDTNKTNYNIYSIKDAN